MTGAYHLYVKTINKEGCQAFFWRLAPAFTCAALLCRENDVYVTETIEHKGDKISRVYFFSKGGGMPELLGHVGDTRPSSEKNGRALELEPR